MEDHHCSHPPPVPGRPPPHAGTELDGGSSFEDIIPGLPDDLAMSCLAVLSHGYFGILQSVCKRWREVIKSLYFSELRYKEGSCGHWLIVSTEGSYSWEAYDPVADRWHPLPLMPEPKLELYHHGFSCVAISKKLMVLGGCYEPKHSWCDFFCKNQTGDVVIFDPFKNTWRPAASMKMARSSFACAAISGKVYVAGGRYNNKGLASAEIYDPVQDRWEALPPMPVALVDCFSISHGGRFHVVGRTEDSELYNDVYVIFCPLEKTWETMEHSRAFERLKCQTTTVQDDHIYTVDDRDKSFNIVNMMEEEWRRLSNPPPVFLPDHMRALEPFDFGLAALHGRFYIVAGLVLRHTDSSNQFTVEHLNLVRVFEPGISSEWKEVRSMFKLRGAVKACVSLEG